MTACRDLWDIYDAAAERHKRIAPNLTPLALMFSNGIVRGALDHWWDACERELELQLRLEEGRPDDADEP